MKYDNLFCKIYIDIEKEYEEFRLLIRDLINGYCQAVTYIVTDWCEISVQKNNEYDNEKYLTDITDFVYWRYYLDIEPKTNDEQQYINNILLLIKYLKEICTGVVVSCDFEDEFIW